MGCLVLAGFLYCQTGIFGSDIIGQWREHKDRTLDSIRNSKNRQELEFLTASPSFGNTILEFKRTVWRESVVDSGEGFDFVGSFSEYEVVAETEDYVEIGVYVDIYDEYLTYRYHKDGSCIYLKHELRNFESYYCRTY